VPAVKTKTKPNGSSIQRCLHVDLSMMPRLRVSLLPSHCSKASGHEPNAGHCVLEEICCCSRTELRLACVQTRIASTCMNWARMKKSSAHPAHAKPHVTKELTSKPSTGKSCGDEDFGATLDDFHKCSATVQQVIEVNV